MRFDNANFRSLNAAIAKMQSEDYQSPERARQTYATGLEGSKQDSKEKRSKKVYGKDGKVLYASLANLRRSLNKKNKKVAESVESAEYTELLESVLLALCDELELDPEELVEAMRLTPKRSAVLDREEKKSDKTMGRVLNATNKKTGGAVSVKVRDSNLKLFNHAQERRYRIRGIRRAAGVGVKSIAAGDSENRPAPSKEKRHEMGAEERRLRTGRTKSTKAHPRRTDK